MSFVSAIPSEYADAIECAGFYAGACAVPSPQYRHRSVHPICWRTRNAQKQERVSYRRMSHMVPRLPPLAFYNSELFGCLPAVEAASDRIRSEANAILADGVAFGTRC